MYVKREAEVRPIEIDGRDIPVGDKRIAKFRSHWNRDGFIVFVAVGDEKGGPPPTEWTFAVCDLLTAIKACSRGY